MLNAALPHAAFDGFTDERLQKAGAEAGRGQGRRDAAVRGRPLSLVEYFSTRTDAEMEKRLAAMDLQGDEDPRAHRHRGQDPARDPEAAQGSGAAGRGLLSLPMHAALGAKLLYRTVDAMWRAAGDTSTDFNFYTKRGILAGVYGSTAMRWFNDTSEDEKATDEFLAARIENVMQFEKFKAKAKEALSNFPVFADWAKPKT